MPSNSTVKEKKTFSQRKHYCLESKHHTMADVVLSLENYDTYFIKRVTQEQLESMVGDNEDGISSIYFPINVYLSHELKAQGKGLIMMFINNGQIHYSHGDVLSDFHIDEPNFYFNYQIPGQEREQIYPTQIQFSNQKKAITQWSATFNYEAIFESFFLDGHDDLGGFGGFFYIID